MEKQKETINCASVQYAYPYPKEKCNLKSILEEDEMNQEEDNVGPIKPKVIISWLDH